MKRQPRVALLIETSNAYARDLLYGIRKYLKEHESWCIYVAEHGRGDVPPGWLRAWKGDGLIARVENQKIAQGLLATGLPTVDVSFGLERSPFPRIVTDSDSVCRLAAEHLLERGFKHFGFCGDARYYWSNLRSRVFAEYVGRSGGSCSAIHGHATPREPTAWEGDLDARAVQSGWGYQLNVWSRTHIHQQTGFGDGCVFATPLTGQAGINIKIVPSEG